MSDMMRDGYFYDVDNNKMIGEDDNELVLNKKKILN